MVSPCPILLTDHSAVCNARVAQKDIGYLYPISNIGLLSSSFFAIEVRKISIETLSLSP